MSRSRPFCAVTRRRRIGKVGEIAIRAGQDRVITAPTGVHGGAFISPRSHLYVSPHVDRTRRLEAGVPITVTAEEEAILINAGILFDPVVQPPPEEPAATTRIRTMEE